MTSVSVSVGVEFICALLSALGRIRAFLFKYRGAVATPDVDMRHPLRSAVDLFRWGPRQRAGRPLQPRSVVVDTAAVFSFYASARSLQVGDGVAVIAVASVAANLTTPRRARSSETGSATTPS